MFYLFLNLTDELEIFPVLKKILSVSDQAFPWLCSRLNI